MPLRLIAFLIVAALLIVFAGFNAGHTSDISFGFTTIHDVPIFVSLFAAFALGVVVSLPLITIARFKRRKSAKTPKPPKITSGGSRDKKNKSKAARQKGQAVTTTHDSNSAT